MSTNPKPIARESRSRARRHGLNSFIVITKDEGSVWTSRNFPIGFEGHVDDGALGEERGMDVGLVGQWGEKTQGHEFDPSIFLFLPFFAI